MQYQIVSYQNSATLNSVTSDSVVKKKSEISNSAMLINATWKQYIIKKKNIKTVEHNKVQHLHNALLDSEEWRVQHQKVQRQIVKH